RIKQARLEAGMTQEQVGEVATFSKRSLQDYESGNTIPYKHLREIASLFKREVPWFLHGESEEQVSELASISVRLLSLEAQVREALRLTNETLQLLREA